MDQFVRHHLQRPRQLDPELRKTPDADKQKRYELLISIGTYVDFVAEQAKASNDPKLRQQAKDLAGTMLKGFFKLDPSQVNITSAGLQRERSATPG